MLHSWHTGCLPSAEVLLCHCEKSVDLIIDNKMCVCVCGLYSAELAWSDMFCESPTSTELEQKSHSHIWQRERQHDTVASRVDGWFIILNCEVGKKKKTDNEDGLYLLSGRVRVSQSRRRWSCACPGLRCACFPSHSDLVRWKKKWNINRRRYGDETPQIVQDCLAFKFQAGCLESQQILLALDST